MTQALYAHMNNKKKKERHLDRKWKDSRMPVAHTCHPSYSGDRDQEA
jgi:hypothetical protein